MNMTTLVCYSSQRGLIDYVRSHNFGDMIVVPFLDDRSIQNLNSDDNVVGVNLPPSIIERINNQGASYFNIDFGRHINKKKVSNANTKEELMMFEPRLTPYTVSSLY